jgi:hypothetical protein
MKNMVGVICGGCVLGVAGCYVFLCYIVGD